MPDQEFINLMQSPYFLGMVLLLSLWTLPWKAMALWRASRNNQKGWFIALLIFNTAAILEIIYIFYFSKKKDGNQSPVNPA